MTSSGIPCCVLTGACLSPAAPRDPRGLRVPGDGSAGAAGARVRAVLRAARPLAALRLRAAAPATRQAGARALATQPTRWRTRSTTRWWTRPFAKSVCILRRRHVSAQFFVSVNFIIQFQCARDSCLRRPFCKAIYCVPARRARLTGRPEARDTSARPVAKPLLCYVYNGSM